MRTGYPFKKLMTFNGDTLDDIIVTNCLDDKQIPIVVNNEITNDFGTGFQAIVPAHDENSLKVAYHYGLSKEGFVDSKGFLPEGLNVRDPETNAHITS